MDEHFFTDAELRENHDFVCAFETMRKAFGLRDLPDAALREIAAVVDASYEELRVARHVRNSVAHADAVNRTTLRRSRQVLAKVLAEPPCSVPSPGSPVPDGRAYRVHAWLDLRLEDEMLANGFVSVGGAEIADLTDVTDPEWIRLELEQSMPGRTRLAIGQFVGYWKRFLWEARPGDLCVLPTRRRAVAIGEFVGPYHYANVDEPHSRHRRSVDWLEPSVPREAFGTDLVKVLNGQHTVQEFKAPRAFERLQTIAATGKDPGA